MLFGDFTNESDSSKSAEISDDDDDKNDSGCESDSGLSTYGISGESDSAKVGEYE